MSHEELEAQLGQLRSEFDRSFANAPSAGEQPAEGLLMLRIGEDRLAVRLNEISGLRACRNLVSVPSRAPELLGIVGLRGGVLPVFSLARLIGYAADPQPPRWLLLCGVEPLGLAFAQFDGHFRAPAGAFRPAAGREARSPHITHLCAVGRTTSLVLSIASVLHALAERGKES